MIKLLVVDDSALIRKVLNDAVKSDKDINVVGLAKDGIECLNMIETLKPDVITLDVEMPRLDGIGVLKELNRRNIQIPVVMISTLTIEGGEKTLEALELGAVDFLPKPENFFSMGQEAQKREIISKIKTAYKARTYVRRSPYNKPIITEKKLTKPIQVADTKLRATGGKFKNLILIGSSTGGPKALQSVIPKFNRDINASIVVVQHMPPKFTKSLADRLNGISQVSVKEAEEGDILCKGCAYIAPGDFHLNVKKESDKLVVRLNKEEPWLGLRPTVDQMFESVVDLTGYNKVAVILTGMGSDGTKGLKTLKPKGCKVIVQDEATSVVYGMPKAVVQANLQDDIVPLEEVVSKVSKYLEV